MTTPPTSAKATTPTTATAPAPAPAVPAAPAVPDAQTALVTAAPAENKLILASPAAQQAWDEIERSIPECKHLVTLMNPNKPGFEEMGGARWMPEIIRIHQGSTRGAPATSKAGGLYSGGGDVIATPFNFVPVYMHYTRAKFVAGSDQPDCRSDDGDTSIYGDVCESCEDGAWHNGEKPACARSIAMLVFSEDFRQMYQISFGKTSYKAGAQVFQTAGQGMVPWEKIFQLNTERVATGGNQYFIFTTKPSGSRTDKKFYPLARLIYEQYKAMRRTMKEKLEVRAADRTRQLANALPPDIANTAKKVGNGSGNDPLTNL